MGKEVPLCGESFDIHWLDFKNRKGATLAVAVRGTRKEKKTPTDIPVKAIGSRLGRYPLAKGNMPYSWSPYHKKGCPYQSGKPPFFYLKWAT
jgi:hypothetical protein